MLKVPSINDALLYLLEDLFTPHKVYKTKPRNFNCYELKDPANIEIENPLQRCLLLNYRKNNPFATMFETFWVLSGRNDIESLGLYLPRVVDFSDDGETWRAGYGPRLRKFGNLVHPYFTDKYIKAKPFDQIKYVYNCLKQDPDSRRAIIGLWCPLEEIYTHYHGGSKDFPCNDIVQFMIRDGKLNCYTYVRSNDVLWGFSGVNVFEWTFLQSLLAYCLNVEVGNYYHYAASMHYYEDQQEKLKQIFEYNNNHKIELPYDYIIPDDGWGESRDINEKLENVNAICEFGIETVVTSSIFDKLINLSNITNSDILFDAAYMFLAWGHHKKNEFNKAIDCIIQLKKLDLKISCLHYLFRQNRKWYKENIDIDWIMKWVIEGNGDQLVIGNLVSYCYILDSFFRKP